MRIIQKHVIPAIIEECVVLVVVFVFFPQNSLSPLQLVWDNHDSVFITTYGTFLTIFLFEIVKHLEMTVYTWKEKK